MQDLHYIQMLILRELLYSPYSKFSGLNIEDLSSDHFAYHLKILQDLKFVKKEDAGYILTSKGKEFANTMDTDNAQIEKQPKVGVLVICKKIENDCEYLLIQTRKKEPYFDYKGFISGKVRFGEQIIEAGMRELKEETGLKACMEHIYTIQEHVFSKSGKLLEDKIFFVIKATNPEGKLISIKEGQNKWISREDYFQLDKKFYDEDELLALLEKGEKGFFYRKYKVEEF